MTSIALASRIVARAMAGVVDVRNQSAACRPNSGSGQPSQACAADSTNVSQSRSIRLRSACVPGALIGLQPRAEPPNSTRPAARAGWRAAHASASITEW